jgi:23S rRNA pseudouridine1911/1915/1917 synthase
MEATTYTVTVTADKAGLRLDRLLAEAVPTLSRVRWRLLIEGGHVDRLGLGLVVEPDRKVGAGEVYTVLVPPVAPFTVEQPRPQPMPLAIVYEDADLIVVDKPAGLVVHPGAGNSDRTLVNALLAHCPEGLSTLGGPWRPGIVHRLDKDTSGLIVVAKSDAAHMALSRQFQRHSVDRVYQALVWGRPDPPEGRVALCIGRSPVNPTRMAAVAKGGKEAATMYRTTRVFGTRAALVECRPETGRTHQIRVHLAAIGHPVVGDGTYGGGTRRATPRPEPSLDVAVARLGRQALHARVIGFDHPRGGERRWFSSELHNDIKEMMNFLDIL